MKISIDLDSSAQFIEKDGQHYCISIKQVWVCDKCGSFIISDPYIHKANIYSGKLFHIHCLRQLYKKSPTETMTKAERADRVFTRASRDKILPPWEIENLAHKLANKLGGRSSTILPFQYLMGIYKGKSIFTYETKPDDMTMQQFEGRRILVQEFWDKAQKHQFTNGQLELATLLTILGDKNAIHHTASRNTSNIRRRKAVDPRNNPKHP